jgi:hypothetical protein
MTVEIQLHHQVWENVVVYQNRAKVLEFRGRREFQIIVEALLTPPLTEEMKQRNSFFG